MFVTAAPDQYVYNSAFHLKMLLMTLAGLNILIFYSFAFRKARLVGPGGSTPLFLWTGIIVFGRMLAFHRPAVCAPHSAVEFLGTCFNR
jgi:hypothetical protein